MLEMPAIVSFPAASTRRAARIRWFFRLFKKSELTLFTFIRLSFRSTEREGAVVAVSCGSVSG
jgi:hypothetical protein